MIYEVTIEGKMHRLELYRADKGWDCKLDGRLVKLDAVLSRPDVLSLLIDGKSYEIKRERTATDMHLWVGPVRYGAEVRDPRSLRARKSSSADDQGTRKLVAAMPGKVVRILAAENTEVELGQGVLVVEAMKMQNEMKSPKKGVVIKMMAAEGAAVNAGDVLAVIE
jgi:biotin carboxyl carrier protein